MPCLTITCAGVVFCGPSAPEPAAWLQLRPKIVGGQAEPDRNSAREIKPGNAVKNDGEEGRQTQEGEDT
jgi:hypothetical protein